MLVLDIASVLLSAINLLLARLDRHVDQLQQRPQAVEALADLYRTTRDWAKAAEQLNKVYKASVASGLPPGDLTLFGLNRLMSNTSTS